MSKITASDRTTLIRLASTLEKGSDERKAILAGLKVARTNWKVVNLSPSTLAKATAVNWWYMMKSNMFGEYTAIRVPSEPDMWALTRGERFDPRKFRNVSSAELLRLWKKVGGWVPRDQGGTPHDPSGESPSHEALHATGDGEARISMDPLPEYRQWRNILAGLEKTAYDDRFGLEFNFRDGFSFTTVPVDPPYNQTYSGFILMKKPGRVKAYNAAMDYIRKNERQIARMKRTKDVFDAINGYAREMTGKVPFWHRYLMPD